MRERGGGARMLRGQEYCLDLASSLCRIGAKAEVYGAKLQEGLQGIRSASRTPTRLVVCVDNQSALAMLASGNPTGSEHARQALPSTGYRMRAGHVQYKDCGPRRTVALWDIRKRASRRPGEVGAQDPQLCRHARVTKTWLQASARRQMLTEWSDKHPPEPDFPIVPSTHFPQVLRKHSPASLRALFRLQSGMTPSDPLQPNPPPVRMRKRPALPFCFPRSASFLPLPHTAFLLSLFLPCFFGRSLRPSSPRFPMYPTQTP